MSHTDWSPGVGKGYRPCMDTCHSCPKTQGTTRSCKGGSVSWPSYPVEDVVHLFGEIAWDIQNQSSLLVDKISWTLPLRQAELLGQKTLPDGVRIKSTGLCPFDKQWVQWTLPDSVRVRSFRRVLRAPPGFSQVWGRTWQWALILGTHLSAEGWGVALICIHNRHSLS